MYGCIEKEVKEDIERSRVSDISNNGLERKLMRTKFQPHIFFGAQVSPYSFTNPLALKYFQIDFINKEPLLLVSLDSLGSIRLISIKYLSF